MIIQNIKLRPFILTLQLVAGISLLTLSYVTTENNWTSDFLNAAIHKNQPANNNAIENMEAGMNC